VEKASLKMIIQMSANSVIISVKLAMDLKKNIVFLVKIKLISLIFWILILLLENVFYSVLLILSYNLSLKSVYLAIVLAEVVLTNMSVRVV
jgi:hypothetical protein